MKREATSAISNAGRLPNWVREQIPNGFSAERRDGVFYLLRAQGEDGLPLEKPERVGIIQEDGIHLIEKKVFPFRNIKIFEYGFSKACLDICPKRWKDSCNARWLDILRSIIHTRSRNSYLLQGIELKDSINTKLQAKHFDICLNEVGTSLNELWETLHDIMLVRNYDTDEVVLTTPTSAQMLFCQKNKIHIGEL